MERQVDLDEEARRLLKAIHKIDDDSPHPKSWEVSTMSRDEKINVLAIGVINGWYNNNPARREILGNLYREVQDRVTRILP